MSVLPILNYCAASIMMTVVNKYVVSGRNFTMTFLLLAIQSGVCVLAVWSVKRLGMITCEWESRDGPDGSSRFLGHRCQSLVAHLYSARRCHLYWIEISRTLSVWSQGSFADYSNSYRSPFTRETVHESELTEVSLKISPSS